jgi:hypothetical protein
MLDSGIGETHVNSLLSSLNVPTLTAAFLKRHEHAVGHAINNVAENSCIESAKLEGVLTL